MKRVPNKKGGLSLIALIIVIVALSILGLGLTFYISEGLRYNVLLSNEKKAIYMAQLGIMHAIGDYAYRGGSNRWRKLRDVKVDGSYYSIGEDANFFLLKANSPQIYKKNTLRGIPIENINSNSPIEVTKMILEWNFGAELVSVYMAGRLLWSGASGSPLVIEGRLFLLLPGQKYTGLNNQRLVFSSDIRGDILANFFFSDGSSLKVWLYKSSSGRGSSEFSIKSTGKAGAGFTCSTKTIVATYDVIVNRITSWEESTRHLSTS